MHPYAHITLQHLEPIFPYGFSSSSEDTDDGNKTAKASYRLKAGGFAHKEETLNQSNWYRYRENELIRNLVVQEDKEIHLTPQSKTSR